MAIFDEQYNREFAQWWRDVAMRVCDESYLWDILHKETGLDPRACYQHLSIEQRKERAIKFILEARYGKEIESTTSDNSAGH